MVYFEQIFPSLIHASTEDKDKSPELPQPKSLKHRPKDMRKE